MNADKIEYMESDLVFTIDGKNALVADCYITNETGTYFGVCWDDDDYEYLQDNGDYIGIDEEYAEVHKMPIDGVWDNYVGPQPIEEFLANGTPEDAVDDYLADYPFAEKPPYLISQFGVLYSLRELLVREIELELELGDD